MVKPTEAWFLLNKTFYRALTRWGYTNAHITVYDTYMHGQYTAISIKI
jgi:hypothetical protein